MSHLKEELDEHLARFERRLPEGFRGFVRWLRKPGSGWTRIPLGIVLILCGFVGFLPILGFWMVPLGLLVLAIDVPLRAAAADQAARLGGAEMAGAEGTACALILARLREHIATAERIAPNSPD